MKFYGLSGQQWTSIIAAWSGWLMDGYVTIAYAFALTYISTALFPKTSLGFIGAVLGFLVGAAARSIGSLAFGNFLGDRVGRRNMLVVTVTGFSIFSFAIGFIPNYDSIGLFAPGILYFLLFLIGMFAGAEYGGGTALYAESVPVERRGVIGAFVQSGFGTGYFIVSGVVAILGVYFTKTQIEDSAWRILFYTTLIPGVIAIVSRFGSKESPVFNEMKKDQEVADVPMIKMLKEAWVPILFAVMITTGLLYINSGTFSYYPVLLEKYSSLSVTNIGLLLLVVNFISLLGVWGGGFIATRIPGRRTAMIIYSVIFLAILYPVTKIGVTSNLTYLYVAYSVEAFVEAMIFSTLPSFLAETFSKKYRTTGVGFTYNAGGIFGGFALFFITISRDSIGAVNGWFVNLALANVLLIVGLILSTETWIKSRAGEKDSIHQ